MEVIRRLISKIKETSGGMYIYTAALIIGVMAMFAVTFETINVFLTLQGVRDFTSQAVVSVATNNAYDAFVGVKEGNTHSAIVNTQDVENRLVELLKLNSNMESINDEKLRFTLENLQVEYENTEKAAADNAITLNFVTTLDVIIPLQFGEDILPPITKTIVVKSSYTPMF